MDNLLTDKDKTVEEVFEQFETIENKLKFQAFGKRKLNKEPKKKGPEVNNETINRDNHENAKELLKLDLIKRWRR